MELLDEVAAQAEPLHVSTSDLARRIKRRRLIVSGGGAAAVLMVALATAAVAQTPSSVDASVGNRQTPASKVDSSFNCGQELRDLDRWSANTRVDALVIVTKVNDFVAPSVSVGFADQSMTAISVVPPPKLLQALYVKDRLVVGQGPVQSTGAGKEPIDMIGGKELCPSHQWQTIWGDEGYEIVVIGLDERDDPMPSMLLRVLLAPDLKTPNTLSLYTHCGVHGFMHEGYWWEVHPKVDGGIGLGDPFQIGQIRKVSPTEIKFTSPTGDQGMFRKTTHKVSQAPPCD